MFPPLCANHGKRQMRGTGHGPEPPRVPGRFMFEVQEEAMRTARRIPQDIYRIRGNETDWQVELNGQIDRSYASKQAAFEGVVAAASTAMREGHEIVILVPASRPGERAFAEEDSGGIPWSSLT